MPTIRLNDKTWEELEKGCVELTILKRKVVTVPEVTKYIINEYMNEGIQKLIDNEKRNKK